MVPNITNSSSFLIVPLFGSILSETLALLLSGALIWYIVRANNTELV